MFFFVVQALTLWSFHVLWLLERWQRQAGQGCSVAGWRRWGAEALIALATLRFDQPDWVFPAAVEDRTARLSTHQ